MPMDRSEVGPDPRKMRGRGNRSRGNFQPRVGRGMKRQMSIGRENMHNKPMNGAVPLRRGMGRMHPYMVTRGRGIIRGRPPGFMPPHPPREMMEPFSPPPLRRGHPRPPRLMGFRGMPPPPRGRGMLPPPPPPMGNFPHPRGFSNGRGPAAHPPPPGRGQRWPGPPGGRRF
ncbi:uncharacterized protein O3C94_003575 [Discoglossus pictus]